MKVLLDTQALLWFVLDDARLSVTAHQVIADPVTQVLVSPATLWEIAIKVSLGKYSLPAPFGEFWNEQLELNAFDLLPLSVRHTAQVSDLPFYHRDPFDRLIIAQSLTEQIPVVGSDALFDQYGVGRIW